MEAAGTSYDVHEPTAVFLGPSLPIARARSRLTANYYPPARMGDIYRLVATGVRRIVLIDGVFHVASSVWPREILEAMDHGIEVIGASSMGALRACELHPMGMIGVGTVFEWYRDGVIDGDDEVALLHADASEGYRALSLPLVDARHRLGVAVERGVLTPEQAAELVAHAKRVSFTRRSRAYLLSAEAVHRWPVHTTERLRAVLEDRSLDIKARDAERALDHVASMPRSEPAAHGVAPSRFHRATSTRRRGLLHPDGRLFDGEALWEAVRSQPALERSLRARAAEQFYLSRLAEHWQVQCPRPYVDAFCERWDAQHGTSSTAQWLRANGLTARERRALLGRRAAVRWMIERGPEPFGVDPSAFDRLPELPLGPNGQAVGAQRAVELCLLAAWARIRGITCPEAESDGLMRRLEGASAEIAAALGADRWRTLVADLACCRWLVRKQPYHFGYTGWSPIAAVLEELRLSGRAGAMVTERR